MRACTNIGNDMHEKNLARLDAKQRIENPKERNKWTNKTHYNSIGNSTTNQHHINIFIQTEIKMKKKSKTQRKIKSS